jgi:hypothetical protein
MWWIRDWLEGWLPGLATRGLPEALVRPVPVPETTDPRIVHLHGLLPLDGLTWRRAYSGRPLV